MFRWVICKQKEKRDKISRFSFYKRFLMTDYI